MKHSTTVLVAWLVWLLCLGVFWGLIAYIAIHFTKKYW